MTFTNLFPSSTHPTHGLFVYERMRRVAAASGLPWSVVSPVPNVLWPLRNRVYRQWAKAKSREAWLGVDVQHPRYRHWPGLSLRRQADAMARGARATIAALVQRGPIVLDAHYLWPDAVAAATLAREFGVPFTMTARGTDLNVIADDPFVAAAITEAAQRAELCAAVSEALGDRFAAVTGLPRTRITDVRNGVDLERFRPGDVAAARAQLALPPHGRLLLGVGRLVGAKGFHLAAAALARLPADVQLVLVGDGPDRARIAELGGARVHFLGPQPPDQVAIACRAADLLVLPSEREGWPNVVTEALASGLPVVATAVGGIPQILGAGNGAPVRRELGALCAPNDLDGLIAALQRTLATPPDRAAVRAFAERYGWDEPVQLLVAVFRRALASANGSRPAGGGRA
ncbi:MAG: glycosyltransferase [Planctomycetes bacterium]|nr:glycosyltransferase [Planctomycetota bacterium]